MVLLGLFGGVLKWWYPQITHFNRVFHYFHHPFWGTTIQGNTHLTLLIEIIWTPTGLTGRGPPPWLLQHFSVPWCCSRALFVKGTLFEPICLKMLHPRKLTWQWNNNPFEDASPIKDMVMFNVMLVFRGVGLAVQTPLSAGVWMSRKKKLSFLFAQILGLQNAPDVVLNHNGRRKTPKHNNRFV